VRWQSLLFTHEKGCPANPRKALLILGCIKPLAKPALALSVGAFFIARETRETREARKRSNRFLGTRREPVALIED